MGTDVVTQVGFCRVEGGKIGASTGFFLNWPLYLENNEPAAELLKRRLSLLSASLALRGESSCVTWEAMAGGQDPIKAIETTLLGVFDCSERLLPIVAYNCYRFDVPFLDFEFSRWLGVRGSAFCEDAVVDAGSAIFAAKLGTWADPWEDMRAFSERVTSRMVAGVRWSLNAVAETIGESVDSTHDAVVGASLCARVFEHFKRVARGK